VCEQLGHTEPSQWNWKIAVEHNLVNRLGAYQESANRFRETARRYNAQRLRQRDEA
jgi:hypothetical protein